MADTGKRLPSRTSNIQSRAQQAANQQKQQTASSSSAAKGGSTTTPTVTETPKVTNTAKAMPSITRPDISRIVQQPVVSTPQVTRTVDAMNLLGSKTRVEPLKKAETPDLLGGETNTNRLSAVLNKWLYEVPESLTERFGAKIVGSKEYGKTMDFFSNTAIDTARTGISTTQGYLNKIANSDVLPSYLSPSDMANKLIYNYTNRALKDKRDDVLRTVFDTTEKRDQQLAENPTYKQYKKTADQWAEQGKGIMDAIDEGRWDIVSTRVGETIGQMLPSFIVAVLTKNPKIAASTIFATVYGDSYNRSLREVNKNPEFVGLSMEKKDDLASLMAVAEAGIESLGDVLELAPFMKGKFSISNMLGLKNALLSFVANWQGGALIEGTEEVATEVLQTLFKQAYGGSDTVTAKELGDIFSDTYFLMQFVGLMGGAQGGIQTHRRNTAVKLLSREADKYDDFNTFEADAKRGGVEDEKLIQEAWAESKGLTSKESNILKYDVNYVEKQESKTTKLYEEKEKTEKKLAELREESEEKNKTQISKLETKLQEIDNQINEIDKSIQEYMDVYGEKEELPATNQETPTAEGENLSEQAMPNISQGTSQRGWDTTQSKESFDRSIEEIKNGTKYYNTDFARNYAYKTSGRYILGDTEQNQQMLNKVQKLLKGIGINVRLTESMKDARGLYDSGIVYYKKGNKELTLYGHEVFHAMMDVINNGKLNDEKLQSELQAILQEAIEEVKKQFGIDGYKSGDELTYANRFAEEWLANAFGDYLQEREISGPKTFVQKIIAFFNQILDLFNKNKKSDLNDRLKYAFDKIASGEVTGRRGTPKMMYIPSASPIDSSTEITQEELQDRDGYAESQEENKTQSEQQEELGKHGEEIVEAGKESDYENDIYNAAMEVEPSEDVVLGKVNTTPQTIRDIFGKDKKKSLRGLSIMKTEVIQAFRGAMTSAKTRILNISPRIGGRLVQMETQRDIYTHRYRERAKAFVEQISKLDDRAKLEIKKALLDYGALASEQTEETLEEYKRQEVAKLKEVLNKYGISEQATNDMFAMLSDLGQRYKDAGLSITLSDIYFPRTVTDYDGLRDYIAEQTGIPQEEKGTLLKRIEEISRDPKLTEEDKEKRIRRLMTLDFHEPGKKSKNAKERKMGLLSEWGEGIYQFYGDPIEALDSYIVTMEDAIQKQLFLGGLQEDAGLKDENVSLEEIIEGLVSQGKISNEDLEEIKKSLSAVLNKKPTPMVVSTAKSIIHISLLANFMSAVTQFDDLGVVILRDKSGLKNIVKAIFGKAGIKYTDLGLENSYEIFKDQMNITNWFFKKSFFNAIDRLGKTSFINTAWESLKKQARKNKDGTDTRARKNLIKRLTEMYGEETASHIMEKIDSNNYMTDGQIDIDVLTDLLYLLSDTQPIYTSDMPTAYLNNGWVRLCYSLQTFTIKRINMLIQGTKQVYENNGGGELGAIRAGAWLLYTTAFLAMFGAMIGDAQDYLKGDKDETTLYKFITEGIDKALEQLWKDAKGSWLKIWNLSDYDKKIYKNQGAWGWLMSKFEPPIIGMGADFIEAITEHDKNEITDLAKYTPIIGKLLYYRFWDELESASKKKAEDDERDFSEDEWDFSDEEEWDFSDEAEWDFSDEDVWDFS